MQPDISISIINSNNRDIVLHCLGSIYETSKDLQLEIFVVNNACKDGSVEALHKYYPQVCLINHAEMLGFSTNNNLVLAQSKGRYLMLLNDDTIIMPGAFQAMVDFLDHHLEVGIVGANLINSDGSPQQCYFYSPNPFYDGLQPISERLFPLPPSHGKPLNVASVHGACLMARASAIEKIGLLDTRFDPLYSEEVDLCFRFRKAGWKIYHLPDAKVVHLGGSTMNRMPIKRYERIFEKKAIFFRKHYGKAVVAVYKLCLFMNNLIKSAAWAILWGLRKEQAKDELLVHWNMTQRALFI